MHLYALLAILLPSLVAAHGDVAKEVAERREFLLHSRANINHCAGKIAERGLERRSVHRRTDLARTVAQKSGIQRRDLASLLQTSHLSNGNYTVNTNSSVLYEGRSPSLVLNPESTEGPFYVAGSFVRQDIVDDQKGVPLAVDVQVLNIETCEPVSGGYLEAWHANATGLYSGIVHYMNGDGYADEANVDRTFHRGLQKLDRDGTAQFTTLFPGHYEGRATHIHIMLHMNATARANGTITDLAAAHVGQMYFDQDLRDEIEQLEPYARNPQPLTSNGEDYILGEEAADADPFMQYVRLGDGLQDGLLMWLTIGVNTSYERTVHAAATMDGEGGMRQVNDDAKFAGPCFTASGNPPFPTKGDYPGQIPTGGFAECPVSQ